MNEAVTLRCNNGYQTVTKKDREKVTCTETGQWSVPILCKAITCVIPLNILYGGIDSYKREFKMNEAVTLRCNNGYQTVNKKDREKATCTETGQWSVPILCKEFIIYVRNCDGERMNLNQQSPSRPVRALYNRNCGLRTEWLGSSFRGQSETGHSGRRRRYGTWSYRPSTTADTKPGLQREASLDLQRTKSTNTKSTAPAPEHPVRKRVLWELLFQDCNPLVLSLAIPIAG
ncbi:UNVERIFIED_CONTAM: hypothetical protein FKN15_055641 [Acipenser sinensis]